METKKLFLGICLSLICSQLYSQNENVILNNTFKIQTEIVREYIINYSKSIHDINDYYLLVHDNFDSINIYLSVFVGRKDVGSLNPFAVYKYKSRRYYIFLLTDYFWPKDPLIDVNKPDFRFSEYPVWLIVLKGIDHYLLKDVKGYFSPPEAPNDVIPRFIRPVIDSISQ